MPQPTKLIKGKLLTGVAEVPKGQAKCYFDGKMLVHPARRAKPNCCESCFTKYNTQEKENK